MKDYILNKIPALTWRWLKMNETSVSLPTECSDADIRVVREKASDELSFESLKMLGAIPTGMGAGMTELMDEGSENIIIRTQAGEKSKSYISIVRSRENLARARVYIYAGEGSEANVWMDYSSKGGSGALAVQTFVFAGKNAKVKLYQAGLQSYEDTALNDVGAHLEKDAAFELIQLLLGGSKNFAGARASLIGKRSEFISELAYYGRNENQIDLNYVADHIGKASSSRMLTSGVLEDGSKKLLRGTIDFKRGAGEAVGEEVEDVLLLGESIVNQTIPVILCSEEDVMGNHGATIGNLDEETLFYLTSRGMDEESATNMVARARIDAVSKKLENEVLEEKINLYLGGGKDE